MFFTNCLSYLITVGKKSDLKVDDINEGVGYDDNDKRVLGKNKREVDKIDLDKLKLNKLQPATEAVSKKNVAPEPKRQPVMFREPTLTVKPDTQYDEDFESEEPEPTKEEAEKSHKSRQDIKKDLLNNVFDTKIVTAQTKTNKPIKTLTPLSPEDELKEFILTPISYEMASVSYLVLFI